MSTISQALALAMAGIDHRAQRLQQERDNLNNAPKLFQPWLIPLESMEGVDIGLRADLDVVYLDVALTDLPGLRDERLENVLELFLDGRWEARQSYDSSYGEAPERIYFFSQRIEGQDPVHLLWVSVRAKVRTDSPTCRKVVLSYKETVLREPVVQIVCD